MCARAENTELKSLNQNSFVNRRFSTDRTLAVPRTQNSPCGLKPFASPALRFAKIG